MHELSLVASLVEECDRLAEGRPVAAVRVRRPASIALEELTACFAELTATGPLAGATLEVETVATSLECACGFSGPLEPAAHTGHLVVCPCCGAVQGARSGLELLSLRLRALPPAGGRGAAGR